MTTMAADDQGRRSDEAPAHVDDRIQAMTSAVNPVALPGGRLLYVTGTANRNSLARGKIFSVETDPATGRFLGAPVTESKYAANSISSISASEDGSTCMRRRSPWR